MSAPDIARARALMVLGTASDVGKSLVTAALCRILRDDGYRVAPFKAQNMSLNSAAVPAGGEIGRAQALQAEAAGVEPTVDMNPVLLKPTSDRRSQVVVRGAIWAESSAADYHGRRIAELAPLVRESYERLAAEYDVVVMEGAGSPAEINLRASDLGNMASAHMADARCLLVGDIDRGGVFAALCGTLWLLDAADRARIVGMAVNKFRGDPALFEPGIAMLEERAGLPVLGVIPYLRDIGLEEEDGVAFERVPRATTPPWRDAEGPARRTRVAVVAWPLISNGTDFDALALEPSVELAFVAHPDALAGADLVVLPGTKSTLAAMRWLRERGFDRTLAGLGGRAGASESATDGAWRPCVFGVCGGMQALGSRVDDPHGVEGGGAEPGLGLLPIATTLERVKVAERSRGATLGAIFADSGDPAAAPVELAGYEIHVGSTAYAPGAHRFAHVVRESDGAAVHDGAISEDGRVAGTYLHGVLAGDELRHALLCSVRRARGLAGAPRYAAVAAARDAALDRLAAHVRASLDVPRLLALCRL